MSNKLPYIQFKGTICWHQRSVEEPRPFEIENPLNYNRHLATFKLSLMSDSIPSLRRSIEYTPRGTLRPPKLSLYNIRLDRFVSISTNDHDCGLLSHRQAPPQRCQKLQAQREEPRCSKTGPKTSV